jgi:hypothetical protein
VRAGTHSPKPLHQTRAPELVAAHRPGGGCRRSAAEHSCRRQSRDTYHHCIATPSTSSLAVRATPFAFVLIWATGFVVAKYAVPYAEPLSFLVLRYIGVVALMVALAMIAAIGAGMPAGVAALVVNLQPVLTGL